MRTDDPLPHGNPGGYPCAKIATRMMMDYQMRCRKQQKRNQWSGPEAQAFALWRTAWLDQCLQLLPPWYTFHVIDDKGKRRVPSPPISGFRNVL